MKATATQTMFAPSETLDFTTVYRDNYRDVVRWVGALGGPSMDADDLAQEVFVVVHRKLPSYKDESLRGWLYTITSHIVSDRRRGSWFRRIFSRPRDIVLEELRDHADDPCAKLEQKELQRAFYQLVEEIHPSRREAFLLFEVGGLSGAEIAALLDVPLATVWTRLHLARKELAVAIGQRRPEVLS